MMIAPVRELWSWLQEHRAVLFLATVASYSHMHYAIYGPPARLLVLPALAVSVFLVIPWAASVAYDSEDVVARALAGVAALVVFIPATYWGHGGRRALMADPTALVVGAALGTLFVVVAAWRSGQRIADWGLGFGEVRWWGPPVGALLGVIMVGIPIAAWLFPELVEFYPRYRPARLRPDVVALLQYQLAMGVYMFCWEYLFRGFMLFGLARHVGPVAAILLQASPFFLLHDGKPEPELISSWFGGILVGWLAWKAKSAWPSFLLHWGLYSSMEITAFVFRHHL